MNNVPKPSAICCVLNCFTITWCYTGVTAFKSWKHENMNANKFFQYAHFLAARFLHGARNLSHFNLSVKRAQMRKMMSSAIMIWLSSCMRVKALRTSGSEKRLSRPLLMSSIRFFIFTDWAWADWKTANSDDLNSFSLDGAEGSSRGQVSSRQISGQK